MAHVLAPEQLDQLLGSDFGVGGIDFPLDDAGELDLQQAGKFEVVLGPHDVGDAALPRL
jgi:hypothetical protein